MTPTLAPPLTPLPELRAWLVAAELMLRDMDPADPRYGAGFKVWNERHATYMARGLAEGEPA